MTARWTHLKAELRQQMRVEAAIHPPEERARDSQEIQGRIKNQSIWQGSRSILFFWPIDAEPDLRPLCDEALRGGKKVLFPKFLPANGHYGAFEVTDLQKGLVPGQFGIREPVGDSAEPGLNVLDLIFVPGISFSFDGARLGRGKGYYDRLLAGVTGVKCGVAFDWQISPEIPLEAHDIRLDCVVTPSEWRQLTRQ